MDQFEYKISLQNGNINLNSGKGRTRFCVQDFIIIILLLLILPKILNGHKECAGMEKCADLNI